MIKKPKFYSKESKTSEENKGSVSGTAGQLGISVQTISNGYNKAKFGTLDGKRIPKKSSNILCQRSQ